MRSFFLAAVALTISCSAAPAPPVPDPEGVVRIAPLPVGPEEREVDPPLDPATRAKNLARRFPGLRALDFVRVLVVPEERSGTCWTEISRPWETKVDLEWTIDGETASASGVADLKSKGWWPIYRSPEGFGLERRASFEAVALDLEARFACRCVNRPASGDGRTLGLRFRWKRGGMPEVSAALEGKGERRGLTPRAVYGHLLTWDFLGRGEAPEPGARCGLHATVAILNDPPIL